MGPLCRQMTQAEVLRSRNPAVNLTPATGGGVMSSKLTRRDILKHALAGTALALAKPVKARSSLKRVVRVGMVGVGSRGTSLLQTLLALEGVEVHALADIKADNLGRAQGIVEQKC